MHNEYKIRRAESSGDARKLNTLFTEVFQPDDIGALAETMFHHLPGMQQKHWFIAEETATSRIVSAFALIPWVWEMEGVSLRVAEMGIVGTLEAHRGRGLMRVLNEEFDQTLAEEGFDLAAIQGIPGFYRQFGYFYAIPLENHVNLPLHVIPAEDEPGAYSFRLAGEQDIPFLMAEDESYRHAYSISAFRDKAHWRYLLTESRQTEYGSDFWIMARENGRERFYCRVPEEGFGTGLIVSEISQGITNRALAALFAFLKRLAMERGKPYIRLNLPNEAPAAKTAIALGAKAGTPYAWQIKIPDLTRLLTGIAPILELRLRDSSFRGYSGVFKLNFYRSNVSLHWHDGKLASVSDGAADADHALSIPADLFPALCLGHRIWRELRHIRPDVNPNSATSALLVETLFPKTNSWVHEQY